MPPVPTLREEPTQIGVPRYPAQGIAAGLQKGFQAVGDIAAEVDKTIQETDMVNELSNATTAYLDKSDQIGRDLQAEGARHEDYFAQYQARHQALVNDLLGGFKNSKAKLAFQRNMADNFASSLNKAKNDARKMFLADETAELDTSTQMNASLYVNNSDDPERQRQILDNFKTVLDFKQRRGVIDANKAGDALRQFKAKTMNLEAAKDPAAFINRMDRGEYQGNDATDLRLALDIAIKVGDGRARRDEKEGKIQSDDAKRRFEREAENKTMKVGEFEDHAKRFGWDKNFTDGIFKMYYGVKVSNPHEEFLIREATAPVYQGATYTLGQIQKAESNLRELAKQGLISTDTEDYRSAMANLQGKRDRLDIKTDVKDRTSTFDARREIQNLYGKFLPGNDSRRVTAEKNDHFDKIERMDPAQREKYVADLRKEFERKKAEDKGPQIHRENLRGIEQK